MAPRWPASHSSATSKTSCGMVGVCDSNTASNRRRSCPRPGATLRTCTVRSPSMRPLKSKAPHPRGGGRSHLRLPPPTVGIAGALRHGPQPSTNSPPQEARQRVSRGVSSASQRAIPILIIASRIPTATWSKGSTIQDRLGTRSRLVPTPIESRSLIPNSMATPRSPSPVTSVPPARRL